ncbi:hypothetical protein [Fibrella arboris]|uniref:hypothetical protein n=1 Tax=Fibrella arboris TaxID=3242486 RepID=UPI0035219B35
MRNPFPALITYMLVQTILLYPFASCISLACIVLIGWGLALSELIPLFSGKQPVGTAYQD